MVVVDHLSLHRIHQQHLARMQSLLQADSGGIDIQNANLRGKDQGIVVQNHVAGRTQAVPVKHSAHDIPIGKQDGSRAVPGLHHGRIILVKIPFGLGHGFVVGPGLRNGDHHRQRQVHTAHHQKFQRIIQHGGIGAVRIDGRKHLIELIPQMLRLHVFLSGKHLVVISPDRVDLSVMHDETVRMRPLPAGVGVGGEAGVHDGDGGRIVRALQIREKGSQLPHQEHALIHDGPAGQGHHVGVVAGLFEHPPRDIQLSVKVYAFGRGGRLFHKALHDAGHTLHRPLSQHGRVTGNLTPAEEGESFLFHDDLEHLLCLVPLQFILGKEEHADAVFPLSAQLDSQRLCHLPEKVMGDLRQDAHTVTGLSFRILSCAVLQIFHDLQRVFHGGTGFCSLNVHTRADTAVVMLKPLIMQGCLWNRSFRVKHIPLLSPPTGGTLIMEEWR